MTIAEVSQKAEDKFIDIFLLMIVALAVIRLLLIVTEFGRHYLNPDFSDYYTAGQALNAGLPIYINNVFHNPPVWDGATLLTRSGFLYPPLVAVLFRPLALLPYFVAKFLWIGVSISCVLGGMAIVARMSRDWLQPRAILLMIILIAAFEPFVTLLEQGQIDGVTFILLIAAIAMLISSRKHGYAAGALVAFATLLKLQTGLFIPFLILRRQWKALAGTVAMGAVLIVAMLLVNGVHVTADYVENRLPHFGDTGTPISQKDIPVPRGVKDGRTYTIPPEVNIASTATLVVEAVDVEGSASSIPSPYVAFSLVFFAALFAGVVYWRVRLRGRIKNFTRMQEFAFWQLVLVIILLSGPLTWVMNVVWMLPVGFILIYWFYRLRNTADASFLAFGVLGLFLAAIPDEWEFLPFVPEAFHPELKYIVAEMIVLISLLYFISQELPRRSKESAKSVEAEEEQGGLDEARPALPGGETA